MRYLFTICLLFLILATFAQQDAVKKANNVNEKKADNGLLNEKVAEFLVKATDARMMDSEEGKMAIKRGTKTDIRSYGELMVKDQAKMLSKIRQLAKKRNVSLPENISNKKAGGREDLSEETGKDFDQKFIKMMIIDHKRDIRQFSDATEFADPEISAFAKEYLPVIKSHLEKIEKIKDSEK